MAVARIGGSSANCVFNTTKLNLKSICCVAIARSNLSYDGKRVKWLNDFELLKTFIANVVKEPGKWTSPGGKSKKFTSSLANLTMTWYYGKQRSLLFQGKSGDELKATLIQICEQKSLPDGAADNLTSDRDGSFDDDVVLLELESSLLTFTATEEGESVNGGIIKESGKSPTDHIKACGKTTYLGGVDDKAGRCCSCSCDRTSTELDDVKLNIEILQLRVDSLQALANTQKISTSEDEYLSEINRLKRELYEEREKTQRIEFDFNTLKDKLCQFERRNLNKLVNSNTEIVTPVELSVNPDNYVENSCQSVQLGQIHIIPREFSEVYQSKDVGKKNDSSNLANSPITHDEYFIKNHNFIDKGESSGEYQCNNSHDNEVDEVDNLCKNVPTLTPNNNTLLKGQIHLFSGEFFEVNQLNGTNNKRRHNAEQAGKERSRRKDRKRRNSRENPSRPNNFFSHHREVRVNQSHSYMAGNRDYFLRRTSKHRPPGWQNYLGLVSQLTRT